MALVGAHPRTTPPAFTTDEARWMAVLRRDPQADGHFLYSVRTTGVYCRPSCASRRARRENVRFHRTPSEAEAAGFRPCRRCRPAARCWTRLAPAAGMSRFHFHRVFKAVAGVTPKAYAAAHRARRVRDELSRRVSVTDAVYGAGFNSSGRFYATARDVLGMTPTSYRSGGAGASIRFAVGECSLGSILVAASDRGVCAILLGDAPGPLVRELQDRFAKARLVGGDRRFERLVATVVGFVEAPGLGLDLPLDVQGTAFQQRVWRALRRIPAGATVTYREVARRIGAPKAVRAVAQACASNALAVAIPCHRGVRSDGALSGYRWGVERKRVLLSREAAS